MELTDSKGQPIYKGDGEKITTDEVKDTSSILTENKLVNMIEEGLGLEKDSTVKSIKASERTRAHLNSPGSINRTFDNMTDLEKQGAKLYAQVEDKIKKEEEEDLANGLDVNNIESIMQFKIPYTPIGNTVLVKQIFEKEESNTKLYLPVGLDITDRKYIVMVPGVLVSILKRGDIITLKASANGKIDSVDRKFGGIKFHEIDYYAISGVFEYEHVIQKRIDEINTRYKNAQL